MPHQPTTKKKRTVHEIVADTALLGSIITAVLSLLQVLWTTPPWWVASKTVAAPARHAAGAGYEMMMAAAPASEPSSTPWLLIGGTVCAGLSWVYRIWARSKNK